ncbi:MAG: TonB-dependent receptor [Bryobacteraceae bacterium]|nr:TonB-dependent receptor [Bryobacteraceae bacterium]
MRFLPQSTLLFLVSLIAPPARAWEPVRLTGRVQTPSLVPLSGARVLVRSEMSVQSQAFTDPQGRFTIELPSPGVYSLVAEQDGYYTTTLKSLSIPEAGEEASITLVPVREHSETVEVTAPPPAIDTDTTAARRLLTSRDIIDIPYPNTNDFRSALRTVTGVVRDNRGGLHVNGAAEDQVLYTLNGFNLNDPLTGRFDSRLSVESIENVEITSGNLPAEFGKGTGGTLAVKTHTGGDRFRFSATNFIPGIENRKGWTLGDWTPRFGVSGPIRRGRTWFSDSLDLGYNKVFIHELPKGEDRQTSLRISNLLHIQHNLTPGQILSGGLLVNALSAPRTGLSAIDPLETTVDRRARQWFFYVKDQVYLTSRTLLEFGYASNRTFGREIPQGSQPLAYTPFGRRGNWFVDGVRKASRNQVVANISPPSFTFLGSHQLRAGIDLNYLSYWQDVRRTSYENYDAANVLTMRTLFGGSGRLRQTNQEVAVYVQDSWRLRPGVLLETGIRGDWDRLLSSWSVSPRLGVSWSPARWSDTRFYAGFGRIADATSLRIFTRQMDQYSLATYLGRDGEVIRGPALNLFTIQNRGLERPLAYSVTFGGAHRWANGFMIRADCMRRRMNNGFAYNSIVEDPDAPAPPWAEEMHAQALDAVYTLFNRRTDRFDSVAVTVRQSIRSRYEWLASYTRSRAVSNTAADVSVEDPISFTDEVRPMPWDVPHRLLSWGYLPLPAAKWAIAFLLDARSGFPYSLRGGDRQFIGSLNALRFPVYFELNLHLERRFSFRGHHWAFRFGSNNITNRRNPDSVNNIESSPDFGRFYGGTGRSLNFRIRWLGRAN